MVKLQDYELTLSGNNLLATPNMLQKLKQKRQGRGSSFVYQRRVGSIQGGSPQSNSLFGPELREQCKLQ